MGLKLANDISYNKGISVCLNALGLAYYKTGKFDSALHYFEKRYEIVTEINDSVGIAAANDNMGIIYVHLGKHDKALELRTKANNIYTVLNMMGHLASGYTWIGNIYKEQGEYNKALENYFNALKIYEDENDEQNISYPLLNISSIYRFMKQYDLAKQYAFKAKEVFIKTKNKNGAGASLYRIAIITSEEKDYSKTISYLFDAKKLFEETQNTYFLTLVNQFLGTCYLKTGNNDIAFDYFEKSLESAQQIGDMNLISTSFQNIGTEYFAKGDYLKALEFMRKAEKVLLDINDKYSLMKICQNFIEIYSLLNQPDSVSKYFQYYQQYSDSIYNEKATTVIAEMQTKYETEKKEKELELSAIKIRQQKSQLVILSVFLIVLLVNGIIFYLLQRRNNRKNLLLVKSKLENKQFQESETKKRIRNSVSDNTAKEILKKLTHELEHKKCYLEPDLNINTLAQQIGTNREYLSQIIHKTFEKNFNEFVNSYRINEAIGILKKVVAGEYRYWNLEKIARKSGFNSSSTFYTAFNLETNMSPGAFKKALKEM
ncbi:MAG: tetratricopeptide repeat protein [Mariniphaga sp.]|nr:tetratricopeptide repeat protein [Mariniphaga sp.]